MNIKRGSIYFATLDPTQGSEINKTRPVLVISNDINNQYSNTVKIIPITSNTKTVRSFEVFVPQYEGSLPKDSKIKCNQIRTIDKGRILNEVGKLSDRFIADIEIALRKHLDI